MKQYTEIFVIVDNKEDARFVRNLNDVPATMVKRARRRQAFKLFDKNPNREGISDYVFKDVRNSLYRDCNRSKEI